MKTNSGKEILPLDTSQRKNWFSQRPQVATKDDLKRNFGGYGPGEGFRCYLCGYRFQLGDYWRFVFATHLGYMNFMTCEKCDHEDVLIDWVKANEEAKHRFWWVRK